MKRFFSLISVFILIFAVVSCGGDKKEKPAYEEQVTKEISAKEGGTVESSDKKTSIEIPGDALDSDITITMTIYNAEGYVGTEGQKVISKVVEFEPSGTVFKKPVIIKMAAAEEIKEKVFSAAVYRESTGEWSYSEHGAYAVLAGKDEAGNPIMQSAAGDPIMLNAAGDPIMTNASGDPIMMSAAGDPIMLAAAGDPIMTNAAGDPIMNAAAGDPIMMTTGHFTAYTFIVLDSAEPVEEPDGDDVEISDKDIIDEPVVKDDDEEDDDEISDIEISDVEEDDDEPVSDEDDTPVVDEDIPVYVPECGNGIVDPDEACDKGTDNGKTDCDYGQESCTVCTTECTTAAGTVTGFCGDGIVQSNEACDKAVSSSCSDDCTKLYSKVICTGQAHCSDGESMIDCPKPGEDFYGQDAQYASRKSCVQIKYTKIAQAEDGAPTGEAPALINQVIDENTGLRWAVLDEDAMMTEAQERCENLVLGGFEDWRIPTPKEFLSISYHDKCQPALKGYYFDLEYGRSYWTNASAAALGFEDELRTFDTSYGGLSGSAGSFAHGLRVMCVRGEEYGKIEAGIYEENAENGTVFDHSTNLMWQKTSVPDKNWKEALAYCENLNYAGYGDWRLPNKNELITLLDYSQTEGPFSQFPGMTGENLWTSTFETFYGGSQGAYYINTQNGVVTKDYAKSPFSVRCVRTSVDSYSETIPVCDETGNAPCKDTSTGYIWSTPPILSNDLEWQYDAARCRGLTEGGITQWRIPTIDELRTLLGASDKLKTGGECKVTDACSDYFNAECFNEENEKCIEGKGFESSLYDYGYYVSGTLSGQGEESEEYSYAWAVDLKTGSIVSVHYDSGRNETRCIYDESLPNPTFPHTDSANQLVWSSMSKKYYSDWYEAAKYCRNLVEGGSNNWRVPTMEELRTLRQKCTANKCTPTAIGEYSVFGDLEGLWSSTIENDDESGELTTYMDFMTASQVVNGPYDGPNVKTRCVRRTDEPETETELEFPFEVGDLIWSKVSEEELYGSENAAQYCDSLNAEGYDGRTDWTLPSTNDLVSLVRKSVCSNKDNFLSTTSALCNKYSFEGYSIFDDMVQLAASDGYIDFARGSMYKGYSYGFVRCVVVLPDAES